MRIIGAILAALTLVGPVWAERVDVPSGQIVNFHEVIRDAPGLGLAYRFRFIAPGLRPDLDFALAEADMMHLCQKYALPRLPNLGPAPGKVVISLSDRVFAFGESVPEAVQFFEIYRPDGTSCVWDGF